MALQLFGDFGFTGGEDVAPAPQQNAQVCINFYPEVNQQNAKEVLALLGCPGLTQLAAAPGGGAPGFNPAATAWPVASSVTNLPVRGALPLAGGTQALVVISNTLYLVTQTAAATPSAFPTLGLANIGTLNTNTGPVCMVENNGIGFGSGSAVVGTVAIVDGPFGYWYNVITRTFTQITDPGFVGADRVVCIDGWFVFNQPNSQAFYTPDSAYGLTFSNAYYALKDGAPDNLVTIFANKETLWLIGEETTEIWYNGGGQYFPFQRLVGTLLQFGCKAAASVSRFSSDGQDNLMWFGQSERGEACIVQSKGFSAGIISTPAFGAEVKTYPITSDAIGYTYQEDAHQFYVLTFPTADVTWVYDSQSGLLHKRLSYDPYQSMLTVNAFNPPGMHRHRSNCFMNFAGMRIVGDYQNGALYWLTRSSYTDAGWPLLAKRRSPHIWDKESRGRVFMSSLQLDFRAGVGNASGMGADPQVGLAISRDGGRTFGQRWNAAIGQAGQFKSRTMWRKLAFGRDNVVDIEIVDPVPRDIIGATLKAFGA
jgi:hypothetical protein